MNRHHYVHSKETEIILHDFETQSQREFENDYGVELLDDGQVFDIILQKHFKTFDDWLAQQVEEEQYVECEHAHQTSKKFSDEGC